MKIELTISDAIYMRVNPQFKQANRLFMSLIQSDVLIPNPDFAMAKKHGRSTYRIPEHINAYRWDRQTFTMALPRGYLARLIEHAANCGLEVELKDRRVLHPERPGAQLAGRIQLRDYQVPAVQAMLAADEGILVAPPGAGKTEMALEILARIGQPTLWVTDKLELLAQVRDRAQQRLGVPREEIGIIGQGKELIGKWLTIGLVGTLARRDLSQWAHLWGAVMIDECHHVPADTWRAIVGVLPAHFRFGLTATPDRADGLHVLAHLYIGPVVHQIERETVRKAGGTITPRLKVVPTDITSEVSDKHEEAVREYEDNYKEWKEARNLAILDGRRPPKEPRKPILPYSSIIAELLEHEGRNNRIVELMADWCPGRSSLALTARIEHALRIQEMLGMRAPRLRTTVIHHKMTQVERQKAIENMRRGLLDLLLAVDIPKEGLDIPRLDQLFLLAGGKNPILIQQAIGRIERVHPGKDDARVVDIVDFEVPIMRTHYLRRRRIYREMGLVANYHARAKRSA